MRAQNLLAIIVCFSIVLLIPFVSTQNSTNVSIENLSNTSINLSPNIFTSENTSASEIILNFTETLIDNHSIENITILNQSALAINPAVITIREKIENSEKITESTKTLLLSADEGDTKEFIIKFKSNFDKEQVDNFDNLKVADSLEISQFDAEIKEVEKLLDDDAVEYIEVNQVLDFLDDEIKWNVAAVGAPPVWNYSSGEGIKVAILDTGIANHQDISIAGGWNVVDNNSDYSDSDGHGTSISGVIGATLNDEGVVGVSPDVSIYSVKIFNGTGTLSDAILGLEWAIDNNMNIVSMSFSFEGYSQIFKEAVEEAYSNGILLIGASGNDGGSVLYPAAYTNVIAVGSVNAINELSSFSNYGFEQELVGPGEDINTTSLNNEYSMTSGTSLAVPHVAGVAALIWSANESLSNEEIRAKLRNDALDLGYAGKDDFFGYGLVQVNITTSNYTYSEDNYYYEIYNISNYGTENETYAFWQSGTGTVDDVDFEQGYYLVNKTINSQIISEIFYVNENGEISLLYGGEQAHLKDNFYGTYKGTETDGIVWVNGMLEVNFTTGGSPAAAAYDGECYDDINVGSKYEQCFFDNSGDRNDCESAMGGTIDCGGDTSCVLQSVGSWHNFSYVSTSTANTKTFETNYLDLCSSSISIFSDDVITYVIDRKRFHCIDANNYAYQGYYGSGWVNFETGSCSITCDDSGAQNYTDPDATITESCTGTDLAIESITPLQVITGVKMIEDKPGYVVVNVSNNGISVYALVKAWYDNKQLPIAYLGRFFFNEDIKYIESGESELFVFYFYPDQSGTNKVINATVEVYE